MSGNIEYKMSADMARSILRSRKGADLKVHPQEYLCRYVNETFGLKGHCVKVSNF